MNRTRTDPYAILGVAYDASETEIRKRYRRLCKRFHPDLNQGDPQATEIFKDVKWAHETIMSRMTKENGSQEATSVSLGVYKTADCAHPFFGFFNAVRAYFMKMNPKEES